MVELKFKINVNLLQLLCVVVSVTLHGEFERFCGFALTVTILFLITYNGFRFTDTVLRNIL